MGLGGEDENKLYHLAVDWVNGGGKVREKNKPRDSGKGRKGGMEFELFVLLDDMGT